MSTSESQETIIRPIETSRMRMAIKTNGANMQPEVADLLDSLATINAAGSMKATYAGRDILDSPVWNLELTAPTITLQPLWEPRRVMVSELTARRSGANCVILVTITFIS